MNRELHNAELKSRNPSKYPAGYVFMSEWHENKHLEACQSDADFEKIGIVLAVIFSIGCAVCFGAML